MNSTEPQTLNDFLYLFIQPCSGLPENKVVEAYNKNPRPSKPFADYHVLRPDTIGTGIVTDLDEDGVQTTDIQKIAEVQVNFYGEESAELAMAFVNRYELESSLIRGEELNLGLLGTPQIVDTSTPIAETYERRYSVRLRVSFNQEVKEHVGLIEHVDIQGEFSH
ncbi:hypothetical protein POR1_11 [Pseudomonas phage POR1]|uniref:Phage neck terminator protein gp12-like domain-containing protein n=1 Tax=Pseudomonas phage POR1 TaxID=1718594 RepID=A0A0N9RYX1_9CAUD|nr:hypothetical protein POR1_11 [Pseudomonas phage POR1]